MRKRKYIIASKEREQFVEVFSLLGYRVESESPIGEDLLVKLIKEKDDPETDAIEKALVPKIIPIWTLLIPAVFVIAIMTLYLIVHFAHLWDVSKVIMFFTFFIPAACFLAIDVIIYFARSISIKKIVNNQPTLLKDIKDRLKK